MRINSDINVLGSLPDWQLIQVFRTETLHSMRGKGGIGSYTAIKTERSVGRFGKAIKSTLLRFANPETEKIFDRLMKDKGLHPDTLLFLFWNASLNNELFRHLNDQVFFPALFGGRGGLERSEVVACIRELRMQEEGLRNWSENTIVITASKYLTLLKKFGLMEGAARKRFGHSGLSDPMFVLFVYWLAALPAHMDPLRDGWYRYGLAEKQAFLDRVMQKRYARFFEVTYSGDRLKLQPSIDHELICHELQGS